MNLDSTVLLDPEHLDQRNTIVNQENSAEDK